MTDVSCVWFGMHLVGLERAFDILYSPLVGFTFKCLLLDRDAYNCTIIQTQYPVE